MENTRIDKSHNSAVTRFLNLQIIMGDIPFECLPIMVTYFSKAGTNS